MKRKYPGLSIRLVLVIPYMTHQLNRDKEYYEASYDDIVIPSELIGIHYKAAIKKRNRWMVIKQTKYWLIFTVISEVPLIP